MHFLLATLGSAGDVLPFVALAAGLRRRGHQTTLLAPEPFRAAAEERGIKFRGLASAGEYEAVLARPELWSLHGGFQYFARQAFLPAIRPVYRKIAAARRPDTVLIAGVLAFGARLAQEALGLPAMTVHISPSSLWSADDGCYLLGAPPVLRLPAVIRRRLLPVVERLGADRTLAPAINEARLELGLAPIRRVSSAWLSSPQSVLGLYPEWFAPVAEGHPAQLRLAGFLTVEENEQAPLPAPLLEFLAHGEPPILFTPGTAMQHAAPFFRAAVEACRILGKRSILLTRYRAQLPARLPHTALYCDYLPLRRVMPYLQAMVHHGGIGTTAQALAAGIPQVIMPMSFDQPDNAARLVRLGVAESIRPSRFTPQRLARKLDRLLSDPAVAAACRRCAQRIDFAGSLDIVCEMAEGIASNPETKTGLVCPTPLD